MKPIVGDKVHIEVEVTKVFEDGDISIVSGYYSKPTDDICIPYRNIVKVIPRKFQVGDFVKCAHADKNYKYEILAMHKNDLWVKRDGSAPFTVLKQNVTRWED